MDLDGCIFRPVSGGRDSGHRERLLEAAIECLQTRGYARTTARDLVEASGTNLASIGYHFGSKEALLNAAMMEAIEEWGVEIGQTLAAGGDPSAEPLEHFEAIWTQVIDSFSAHRQLWVATVEALAQAERAPDVRAFLADALQEGRLGLAALFQNIDATADPQRAWVVGSLLQALMSGIMVQWMIDPQRAPSGHDLADAVRMIVGGPPK